MLFRLLLLALLALWGPHAASAEEGLTSPRAVRELDRKTAAQGLPVRVSGVVTFVIPPSGSFIVDDGTTAVYVAMSDVAARRWPVPKRDFSEELEIGMRVEVSGVTAPGGFAPVIVPQSIRWLGRGPLPVVKPASVTDLQTGRFDCERVKVRGVVQNVALGQRPIDAVRMELAGAGGHFIAYAVQAEGFKPEELVDAEVDLSGVALTFFNERGEIVGARVQIQGMREVEIVRPAPASPFDVPEVSLDALLPFSPEPPLLHRRRVIGTVTVCRPGAYFYVQEGPRAVRVSTRDPSALQPGDRVEASGFVELWQYYAEVREAVFRKIGTTPLPPTESITHASVMTPRAASGGSDNTGHLDGKRVALRGRLEKIEDSDQAGRRLSLDCDGHLVFATIVNEVPEAQRRLAPGSEVEVVGACQVQLSVGRPTLSNPVPTGFQLLVNSVDDVRVLRVPPWWTAERLWLALGGVGGVLALVLAWVWQLRRRVAQRGAQLAAEIGSRREAALEFDATLRERKRLAADLHDTLEQALTGLALQLEAVDLFRSEEPERSTHHLRLARQFLARSREDVRRSVWNLRAQGLEGRTLEEALRGMLAALTQSQPVQCSCEVEGTPTPLPDFIAGNLLLLAQEAVTNALKHGQPKQIMGRLIFRPEAVVIEIKDDGTGFDSRHAPGLAEGHFGLQGMRERVKRLNGTLEIETTPGAGARISATVPIR